MRSIKIFLALSFSLLFYLGVAVSGTVTLEVGTVSAEDGDRWLLSQIKDFEQHHPHIRIRHFAIGVPSRDEVRIEDLPELALNIVGVRSDRGNEVAYLVDQDLLVPLEEFFEKNSFPRSDFFDHSWDYVTYQGKTWGIPYLAATVAFIADWELFERAGISQTPKTWEDLLQLLPRLTRDRDGDGELDQWGFRLGMRGSYDTHLYFLWMTQVLQRGGNIMREGRFDLSHPALLEAYKSVRQLQESFGSHEDNRRFKKSAGDQSARYALQIAPSYFLDPLAKQRNYRIVPWPTAGREVLHDERRHYLCIGRSTPEKERASWEFLQWIARPEASHPDAPWGFQISCRKDLLDRPDIRAKIDSWAEGFDELHRTKGWNIFVGDQVPGKFEAMETLETIVTDLFRGTLGFEEAMLQAETECNAILDRHKPTASADLQEASESLDLLARADRAWRDRDFEAASRDYLHLWGRFPERASDLHTLRRCVASLRNASRHLEAEAMLSLENPALAASLFEEEGNRESRVDRDDLREGLALMRIACASAFAGVPAREALAHAHRVLSTTAFLEYPPRHKQRSIVARIATFDLLLRQATNDDERGLHGDFDLAQDPVKEIALETADSIWNDAIHLPPEDPLARDLWLEALALLERTLEKTGGTMGMRRLLSQFIEKFPEAPESGPFLLRLARLHRAAGDAEEAYRICGGIVEDFATGPLSREALHQHAFWLFEDRRYSDCSRLLEDPKSLPLDFEREVMASLCKIYSGQQDRGVQSLEKLIAADPDRPLAREAQAWLTIQSIAAHRLSFPPASPAVPGSAPAKPSDTPVDRARERLRELLP
jgi:ABC-type glycerol-3-phosphate transport system substrate-binding protein/tetratricopeptide (TPR) repeat protein